MATNGTLTGWMDPPNGRGTFDILKTSLLTIFLLAWSSVCPNLPSITHSGSWWKRFSSKIKVFSLAILGPEFVFLMALGQFCAASRAKKAFSDAGYSGWNLRLCFFTNMGGIHLTFEDRKAAGRPSFPVDCEQLLQLVRDHYVDMPKITLEDIDDRNKSDSLARGIAIVQSLWFLTNSIGRLAQGLHLTTLELTTLSFVFAMTGCSICWWRKPMDISRPMLFPAGLELKTILVNAVAPTPLRGRTPLSFLNRNEWSMSQHWAYMKQLLRNAVLRQGHQRDPAEADHFLSTGFEKLELKWEVFCGPFILMYSGIFLAAWNFQFPTYLEQLLWRIAGILTLAFFVTGAITEFAELYGLRIQKAFSKLIKETHASHGPRGSDTQRVVLGDTAHDNRSSRRHKLSLSKIHAWFDGMRNISPDRDPEMAIALRWSVPMTLACAMYCFSRIYFLTEDLIGLRALPPSAYENVDFGPYSPIL